MNFPTISLILFFFAFLFFPIQSHAQQSFFSHISDQKSQTGVVDKIYDAATVGLNDGRKISLIGLKPLPAPRRAKVEHDQHGFVIERFDPTVSVEERAYSFTQNLLKEQEIRVEFDTQYRREDGSIMGYIFLIDGTLANAEILRHGYADLSLGPPNKKHDTALRQAYQEARSEKRGIHGE